jgi:imidazoleglycerol phosphate dehydratase HisB
MLEQFAKNSLVNIFLKASGDLEIDTHHTIEDVAILLGDALSLAMGDRSKITRYASSTLIMDESRAEIDVDLCTRSNLNISIPSLNEFVGEFPTEMLNHFLDSFIKQLRFTCHIKVDGQNTHHLIEILFKCLGKCFRDALKINERMATSTKGIL